MPQKAKRNNKPAAAVGDAPASINLEVPQPLYQRLLKLSGERGISITSLIQVALMNCARRSCYYDLDTRFGFGKYADATAEEVIRVDPGYVTWALKNLDRFELSEKCLSLLEQIEKATR